MNNEFWKELKGLVELGENYAVSSFGRIKNIKTERILKPHNVHDYLRIEFTSNGKRKTYAIHQLVAIAFIPNPSKMEHINHKSENKQDNHVSNLEWCNYQYNNNYGTCRERGRKKMLGKNKGKNSPLSKQIIAIKINDDSTYSFVGIFESIRQAGIELNIHNQQIVGVLKGKYRHAKGFKFIQI